MTITREFPVSQQQRRMCALQGEPFAARCLIRLDGDLDPDTLRVALDGVVGRHEILRPALPRSTDATLPMQVVSARGVEWGAELDLRELPLPNREARLNVLYDELTAGSDEDHSAALRARLVTVAPAHRALLLVLPGRRCDERSFENLIAELAAAYSAGGIAPSGGEQVLQYHDYCAWQASLFQDEEARVGREFWQRSEWPGEVSLPFAKRGTRGDRFTPRSTPCPISSELARQLELVAAQYCVAESSFLLACWYVLLERLTQQPDLLFGYLIDGRPYEDLEPAMGPFSRVLPLACRADKKSLFCRLLDLVENRTRDALAVEDYFHWDDIQRDGTLPRFDVCFDFRHARPRVETHGLSLELQRMDVWNEPFQLSLACRQAGDAWQLLLRHDASLLGDDLKWLAAEYCTLLSSALANPVAEIQDLAMLDAAETDRILTQWNRTQADYPRGSSIDELFVAQAAKTPHNTALVAGSRRWTFAQLDGWSTRIAHLLRSRGAGPEKRIAFFLNRSPEAVAAMLGILKSGAAYVPLDPSYPAERLAFVLADAAAECVVTTRDLAAEMDFDAARVVTLEDLESPQPGEWLEDGPAGGQPGRAAYVLYTSGSTGRPKGVVIEHRALVNFLSSMQREPGLEPSDVLLAVTSLSFDISGLELLLPLLNGARVVLAEPAASADGGALLELMETHGVTVLQATPATWHILLAHGWEASARLKALCGGEALSPALAREIHSRSDSLWNMYGPTETTVWSAIHEVDEDSLVNQDNISVPIGRPIANTSIYVLAPSLQPVAVGIIGELYIGGEGLARGYLNRPALTAEKFLPDPFCPSPGRRMYRTGDLARYRPDGTIDFLGRVDHQVKIRGFRIELSEIEAVLAEHPEVRQCAVVTRTFPAGDTRLVAYLVATPHTDPSMESLREHLARRLPDHMLPARFVLLDAMPLTPNGKTDRGQLPEISAGSPGLAGNTAPPRTPTERQLVEIWEAVLGVAPIGINDHYLTLGGDSLTSIQIVGQAAPAGLRFTPIQLFQTPTVATLAEAIGSSTQAAGANDPAAPPLVPSTPAPAALRAAYSDVYPATGMQELLLANSGPAAALDGLYHLQYAFHLRDRSFSLEALRAAVEATVARTPVLWTRFVESEGRRWQVLRQGDTLPLRVVDARQLPASARDEPIETWMREDRQRPFAVEDPGEPLFRIVIILLAPDAFAFCMSVHHALIDGWSFVELLKQLGECYTLGKHGRTLPGRQEQNVFREFVALEEETANSPADAEFWAAHLADHQPHRLSPRTEPAQGATSRGHMLGKELAAAVQQRQQELRVTPNAIHLTALMEALSSLIGKETVTVGVVANGRSPRLSDPLGAVGLFWNIIPFCWSVAGGLDARLQAVHERLVSVGPHAAFPLSKMVARQNSSRPAAADHAAGHGRSPDVGSLFFATFNYVHLHNARQLQSSEELEVVSMQSHDRFHFPLNFTMVASPLDGQLNLQITHDPRYFDEITVESLAADYQRRLSRLVGFPANDKE